MFGLGGIGLNVIQGLRLAGADMIIGVDVNNARKEWGERFGMTHFVNPKEIGGDLVPHLVNMTKRGADQIGGADYTFECVGNVELMRAALESCHRGWGESIIIGVAPAGAEIKTRPFQLVTGRVWRGTAFGGARGRTDVPKIVDWYMEGKIEIDPMITHVMPLSDINRAFDLMHEGKSIRASSAMIFIASLQHAASLSTTSKKSRPHRERSKAWRACARAIMSAFAALERDCGQRIIFALN